MNSEIKKNNFNINMYPYNFTFLKYFVLGLKRKKKWSGSFLGSGGGKKLNNLLVTSIIINEKCIFPLKIAVFIVLLCMIVRKVKGAKGSKTFMIN